MLLRSASTPLLNSSWIPHSKDPSCSSEPEFFHQIPRTRSISITASSSPASFSSSPSRDGPIKRMTRAMSENDLFHLSVPRKKPMNGIMDGVTVKEEEYEEEKGLFLSPGLCLGLEEDCEVELVGVGAGCGGDGSSGGRGRNGGSDGRDDNTDVYYQKMIEANPGNSLLLSNYAKFLKEVCGDFAKAEEYCGKAILANPNDGNVLSMYADLIWSGHKDASRAETYFDRAIKTAPDDCFVMASYAWFLWDAEEEDAEEEGKELSKLSPPTLFHGIVSPSPPLASAS